MITGGAALVVLQVLAVALAVLLPIAIVRRRERRFLAEPAVAEALHDAKANPPPPAPAPPAEPWRLEHRIVIPGASGRSGAQLWGPGPSWLPAHEGRDGSCQEAAVKIGHDAFVLIVRLGPVQDVGPAVVRAFAEPRYGLQRTQGPESVVTALGETWVHTFVAGRSAVTDWHVDRDGWAWVVGCLRSWEEEHLLEVAERMVATWRWTPAPPPSGEPVG